MLVCADSLRLRPCASWRQQLGRDGMHALAACKVVLDLPGLATAKLQTCWNEREALRVRFLRGRRNLASPTPGRVPRAVTCIAVLRPQSHSVHSMVAEKAPSQDAQAPRVVRLEPVPLTPEAFAPFGQVVVASEDGAPFGDEDASLDLSQGQPRVYIMRLRDRTRAFNCITHHARVTQCLGAVGAPDSAVWYLGVAAPTLVEGGEAETTQAAGEAQQDPPVKLSSCGHHFRPPAVDAVTVFRMEGPVLVKLHRGTWHAGPLFTQPSMDFYNLELADTNVTDHTTHSFLKEDNVVFEF